MSSQARMRRVVVAVALLLVLGGVVGGLSLTATAAPGQPAKPVSKLTPRLERLAQPSAATSSVANQAAQVGLPSQGPGSLLRLVSDRVLVEVRVTDTGAATLGGLRAAGAQITAVSGPLRTVTAAVRPTDLHQLGAAGGVESIQEVFSPMVNRGPSGLAGAAAPAAPCNPTISEGDSQLRADIARSQFSVDGTGTTVGVLSDSFDTDTGAVTHASNDVASGNLPGPGNPCGHTTAVNVVDDSCTGACPHADEGRAMSQIVHGLAPGANLAFATANTGETAFAGNITALAGAPGAKVIVDDFTYYDEPVYQDGPLANAVTQVRSAGVAYFSSAANNNMVIAGKDVGSYEATVYRGTPCPTLSYTYLDCHDFNPSGGSADSRYDMTVSNNATLDLELQWAQPWYGVTTDLDLYVLDATNGAVLTSSLNDNIGSTGTHKPFERVVWQNTTGAAKNVAVVVSRYAGAGVRFKLIHLQNGGTGISSVEYSTSVGTDVIGPTIFGHNGAANAFSVAAVPYNNSATPEYYSSHGPVTLLYGPVNGTTPAAALGSPQVLAKPDFTATDGGRNTYFGPFDGVNYRFYGTSAAAPHAAAVAALLRQVNPTITPAQVGGALTSTARSVGGAPAATVGAGLIDADAAAGGPSTQSRVSTSQYTLANSDGSTWQEIDATNLRITTSPSSNQTTLLTANADLFTANATFNQDIGIFASDNGGADSRLAWKESGGFAGIYSPNAAYVQSRFTMTAGHVYVFKLKWKTNHGGTSIIYAGAGGPNPPYSPTRLTAETFPSGVTPNFAVSTSQYTLNNSDGATWQTIDATNLATTLTPASNSTAVLGGNVDLFTGNATFNQDIAIAVSDNGGAENILAWKESGGFAGTYSPNAAFVTATYAMTGPGHTYNFKLKWKTNHSGTSIIYAAAGNPGNYSPTSLVAQSIPTGANPYSSVSSSQYTLTGSDGATWQPVDSALNLSVSLAVNLNALLGANLDLFTNSAGYNQDIGIFVSDNGGADTLVAWKESGGFAGTYSPNAAFVQALYSMTAGHVYVFKLKWKANKSAAGATLYAAAGAGVPYSPTRLAVELTG